MIKSIVMYVIKSVTKQSDAQLRLNILIGEKKEEYIKLTLPNSYVPIIEVIARCGVTDSLELAEILQSHSERKRVGVIGRIYTPP